MNAEYIRERKSLLQGLKNLTEQEIKLLVNYEFSTSKQTIEEQVNMYFLKVKSEKPSQASEMMQEIDKLREVSELKGQIRDLANIVYRYYPGMAIYSEDKLYFYKKGNLEVI